MSDMKYSDDNAIFHYLCGIYDAHAYKEMGGEEQKLYNKLVIVIPELGKKCKELFDYGMMILNMIVEEKA